MGFRVFGFLGVFMGHLFGVRCVRSLFGALLVIFTFFIARSGQAAIEIVPNSLPVTLVQRSYPPPQAVDAEGAPIELVTTKTSSAILYTQIAPADLERFNVRVKPVVVPDSKQDEARLELDWTEGKYFTDFLVRTGNKQNTLLIELEDGTWAKTTSMGIHVDATSLNMYVPFRVVELLGNAQKNANLEVSIINVPLSEIANRILTRSSLLTLPHSFASQSFGVNFTAGRVIPVVVVAFEAGHRSGHPPGPLAPFIPGFQNGGHSALVVLKSDLVDSHIRSLAVMRIPVSALRTLLPAVQKKADATVLPATEIKDWFSSFTIASFGFTGQEADAAERYQDLRTHAERHFPVADRFELTPAECRDLIVRKQSTP